MSRAMRLGAAVLAAAALSIPEVRAQDPSKVNNLIGMVDYSKPPDFRTGTWIRYQVTSGSATGQSQRFWTTMLIAGEERFWGDDGFWLETWTEYVPDLPAAAATLMSYAVFQDSFPHARFQHYMRKTAAPGDESAPVVEEVVKRSLTTARVRKWLSREDDFKRDTLGRDTVVTPLGTFDCVKIELQRGIGKTEDTADSTIYTETRETRTEYRTPHVPISHLAREDIEYSARRRAWRRGQSQEGAPFQTLERSWLSSRVIASGAGDKASAVLPAARQKSLREQFPAEFAAKKPAARPGKPGAR